MKVPVSGKVIGDREKQYMHEAVDEGWLTTGKWDDLFCQKLGEFIGVKHVLTCNSGSSANLLALSALTSPKLGYRSIRPGDEVITVAAGFPTTLNPILQVGAIPVFVDVDVPGYNVNVNYLEDALSPKTKAVVLAHTLGNPFDIDAVLSFCRKNNLWLVEDCCDALGSTYDNKHVGTFGDISTLSFYPAHHITMGEGGAVFTNRGKLKLIIESFRDWGRDCFCPTGNDNTCKKRFAQQHGNLPFGYDHKYTYANAGYNLKITDIQAACGVAQLESLPEFINKRKNNFARIYQRLEKLSKYLILPIRTPKSFPSWFGFPITLKYGGRLEFQCYLDQHGIGTRVLFGGNLTKQPYMKGKAWIKIGTLENTDRIMNDTIWLGVWPGLNDEQIDYMCSKIEDYFP